MSTTRPLALVTGARADKVLPDRLKSELHRKMAEPGSGDQE
ncbi:MULTISPECIES: hypothetical protein [Streptomyces]|uniref:Uncharacterized protein n=2 Tax=Streptomyces TaxID=1883 RepID=A0ABU2RTX2_9ACTN|nr:MULTISPECIES: hypothetical protein [unclassified Streptomyces]MDT0430799.1 hypothetical protein [Streptomyces sp. DSM 41770]